MLTEQDIIVWHPHLNQLKIADDTSRFKVIVCGRRFGKTTYAVSTLIEKALETPGGLFFYIAPTYRQAKMIAWEMLLKTVRESLPKSMVLKIHESELYVTIGNHAKIFIKGADNPDSLRGVGLSGAVLDEYADMKPNVFSDIIEPALLDKKGWAVFIGTPKGFNHFYDLYTEAQGLSDWKTFHFTSYDNPLIDPKELDKIREKKNEDTFAREYLAQFRKLQGLIYKEFDREKHVVKELPANMNVAETLSGLDFGFRNPMALLTVRKDTNGVFWFFDEVYERELTDTDVVEKAKNKMSTLGINMFYPDPENPAIIKSMRDKGLPCREANKEVEFGIVRVKDLFKQNRIRILSKCKWLIWELDRYTYKEQDTDKKNESEEPRKKDDHACDAMRYVLVSNDPIDYQNNEEMGLYSESYA